MNHTVGIVAASDDDDVSNSDLSFSLVDSEHLSSLELLAMSEEGTLVVAGDLDREAFPFHTLTVAVTDNGDPPLMAYARITVTVLDINDHIPMFPYSFYTISVPEDTSVDSTIFTAQAFDRDAGSNSQLSFVLGLPGVPFSLNPSTGELAISQPLDAETQAFWSLNITVYNPVSPTQSSLLQLNISVLDVLDSPPSLTIPSNTVSLPENLPPYTTVTSITAQGNTWPVYYDIMGGNELGHFFIEPVTGTLRTSTILDRETVASYTLTLQGAYASTYKATVECCSWVPPVI